MENSNQTTNYVQQTLTSTNCPKVKPILKRGGTLWRCLTSSDISYVNKYKPKMLSRIALSNLHSENIRMNNLRKLRKALTDTKRASSLYFNHLDLNSKQLTFLLNSTNHWRRLEFFDLQNNQRMNKELIKSLPRLARYKNLSNFPFPRFMKQHINREIVHRLWRQLRKLNHLEELRLETPLFRHHNATLLTYRPSKSLLSLHLDFKHKDTFNQQQLSIFLSSLKTSRLLEDLTLIFFKDFHIEPSDVQIWTSFFKNSSSHLKKFKIDFTFSAAQQPEAVQQFMESFKYLKNLITFDLSFEILFPSAWAPSILDALFPSLFTSLQYLNHLEALILKSFTYHEIKIRHIDHLNSTLQYFKNLKKLELHLPYPQSPDETLLSIGNSTKQMMNLKIFDLTFDSLPKISPQTLQAFSKSITHLQLTSLSIILGSSENEPNTEKPLIDLSAIKSGFAKFFGISKNNETPPSLIPFFSDLSQFKLLSALKLGLSAFQISAQEVQHLSLILKQLDNLSSLHLTFGQFDSSHNFEDLRNLLSCFPDIPKLARLNLVFEKSISNQEIGFLSSFLSGCQSLKSLTLNFKKANQLTDESLAYLLVGIRGLLTLQDLSFVFQRNERFGEKIVAQFLEGLMSLRNLSMLFFLYDQMSMFDSNNALLPPNLKDYEKLRYLTHFIVDKSSFL